jgi:hypothetical protein
MRNMIGFRLWSQARMENCVAFDNLTHGIMMTRLPDQSPRQEVVNCTVAGEHSVAGIDVQPGVDAAIRNTISVGSLGPAIRINQGSGQPDPTIEYVIVQTDAGANAPTVSLNGVPFTVQDIRQGEVVLAQSPGLMLAGEAPEGLFEDYANGVLTLMNTSSARDFATPLNAPATDLLLHPRGIDGRLDNGAYEYASVRNAADSVWLGAR